MRRRPKLDFFVSNQKFLFFFYENGNFLRWGDNNNNIFLHFVFYPKFLLLFVITGYKRHVLLLSTFSYSVFHRFRQAKFAYSSSILSPSQFSLLPQLPLKMTPLIIKVVKIDLKIIISLP